ncbi:hypothetical protein HOY34_14550 [Xinfangfangia sp. D13-10-4-6]|uniref:hypothetical protein n=1 Tax=Pseudogemmobacter hezensis TaxID=2737662 RepID=UPI001552D7F6|nr:hypothetical protein [Pseudogemmobacter hezensis]NPD16417.1 hypothetical protein [Pseudogemmobacter hezensis]
MFQNWGFLLGEIWVLLVLAALVGLFAGWLIFGRREASVTVDTSAADAATAEAARLRVSLGDCEKARGSADGRIAALEGDLAKAKADLAACNARAAEVVAPVAAPAPLLTPVAASKPVSLTAARGGKADDLKLIKGIGPVLEELCHKLGYYHFDQIAAWTDAEIAWVDENLEGFRGRVSRDEWVQQARDLAAGKPPRPDGEH